MESIRVVEMKWLGRRVVTPECAHEVGFNPSEGRYEAYCPHDRILYVHTLGEPDGKE